MPIRYRIRYDLCGSRDTESGKTTLSTDHPSRPRSGVEIRYSAPDRQIQLVALEGEQVIESRPISLARFLTLLGVPSEACAGASRPACCACGAELPWQRSKRSGGE